MSVLIVANVVSGAVVSGYRRIGVLKSIGFTPAQVAAAYAGQVTVPAVAGCLAGVALGNALAVPLLAKTARVYGVGSLAVPVWVDVSVPAAICGLAGIAALIPALRAGRLSAVQAIATGRAPRSGRGYRAHRLLGRLPLPRAVSIGLAAPFARPGRTALTLAAVVLGATAVSFAVGLTSSLRLVTAGLSREQAQPVQIYVPGAAAGPPITAGASVGLTPSPRRRSACNRGGPPRTTRHVTLRRPGAANGHRARPHPAGPRDRVPRQCDVDRLRPGQRALVQRPRPGGRPDRIPQRYRQVRRRQRHVSARRPPDSGGNRRRDLRHAQPRDQHDHRLANHHCRRSHASHPTNTTSDYVRAPTRRRTRRR